MGVLSMDGSSNAASSNFTCQKCGCACNSRGKENSYNVYDRENQAFFNQVDHAYQSDSSSNFHLQFQPPQSTPTTTTTGFQDFHHRHHHATTTANLELQHQVESLKARLKQTSEHVEKLEHALFDARQKSEQETKKFQAECRSSRDKYERLLESHKQMQRVNQMLEDKVIVSAEKFEAEGAKLRAAVVALTSQLKTSASNARSLEVVNEGLRRDCSVAVRLLQCRSSSFVTHRFDDLPASLRDRVKASLTYEEIERMEEERKGDGGKGGGGGLWSFFTLPSTLAVPTFPPSAAFFDEKPSEAERNHDPEKPPDVHSVLIDMGEMDDATALSTSVLARVFDPTGVASAAAVSGSASGTHLGTAAVSSLTPEQENLLKLYGGDPASPSTLKPDVFPCSSSSSSTSDANEVNVQYYKCRRCRLRCVTCDKWTQTPLAPIYGGNGTPTRTVEEEEVAPPSLPIHLLGLRAANPHSSSLPALPLLQPAMKPWPAPPPSFPPASTLSSLPPAHAFPDLGAFPDLVASAELTTRSRLQSASSSTSSRTIHSQTDALVDAAQLMSFTHAAAGFDPLAVSSSNYLPFDTERRRHDSETGSAWGDIHFSDSSVISHNLTQTDVVLDLSGEGGGGGGYLSGGGVTRTNFGATVEASPSALSQRLEEIALNEEA